jgi:hypothetical protein
MYSITFYIISNREIKNDVTHFKHNNILSVKYFCIFHKTYSIYVILVILCYSIAKEGRGNKSLNSLCSVRGKNV